MASKKVEMYAKKRYELDEIKNKIKEEQNIEVENLDYDFDEDEVKKYNVGTTLPVLIFMDQDKELFRLIGEKNYEEIMKAVGDVK